MPSSKLSVLPERSTLLHVVILAFPLSLVVSRLTHPTLRPVVKAPASVRCCGPECRARLPDAEKHYDKKYFEWQTKLGKEKAAEQNWDALLGTRPGDVVADLGAGGGHILATLNVSGRIAVEINPDARAAIERNYPGVKTYIYPEDVPDESIDLLYSTSALEHFECPLTELREMARKVKVGGRVIIGVKNEGIQYAISVRDDDINQHLWTWNRQLLYNLVKRSGFVVERIDPPTGDMIKKGQNWQGEASFKSFNTFVYHWARGVKKVASEKLEYSA